MNIFYLDPEPKVCAEMHLDKHVVKMIIEYAQLMSTAHRMLDGEHYTDKTASNRNIQRWRMKNEIIEHGLMKASHINHPSNVWARANHLNYKWLYELWCHLLHEYTYRYEKIHACARLKTVLAKTPDNISLGLRESDPTPAMPDDVKILNNSLASYRQYYVKNKAHLAKWKKRPVPEWYTTI